MKILGKEIEFDFFDAEQMEKWDKGTEELSVEMKKINLKNMKQSEFIRKFCTIIDNFFDNVFGDGTAKKIFEGKKNFKLYVASYRELVKARKEQEKEVIGEMEEVQKELQEIDKEYSPNRATRRAKK